MDQLKKGFTMTEVILSLSLVIMTLTFSLFSFGSMQNDTTRTKIHYLQALNEYNIIQIINNNIIIFII